MAGDGRAHKPYTVNIGKESTFKTKASSFSPPSGPIQEQPSLTLGNDELKVTKHNELGENHDVVKGGTKHTFGYKYPVEDWRGLFKILAGTIDNEHLLFCDGDPTVIAADVDIASNGSGSGARALGVVESREDTNNTITLKKFVVGETITIGAFTGTLVRLEGNIMWINSTASILDATNYDVIGAAGAKSNGLTDITDAPAVKITLNAWADGNDIYLDGGADQTLDVDNIRYQHSLFVRHALPCYSGEYNYESLANQHDILGMVLTKFALSGAGNNVPSVSHEWEVADHDKQPTKADDATITGSNSQLYRFEDLTLLIDSVDYSGLVQKRDIEFSRELGKIWASSLSPAGMQGPTLVSKVTLGIYRQDYVLYELNIDNDNIKTFETVFTWVRGTWDSCAITFASNKALEISEGENEKSVFLDLTLSVIGTPTVVIVDEIADYSA